MEADLSGQIGALGDARSRLLELDGLAAKFGNSLSRAFGSGIASGKSFDDVLRSVGQRFIEIGVTAAVKPAANMLTGLLSNLTSGLTGALTGQYAGAGPITPFADGGIIAAPSYFPLGSGTGLAGEAGPEAILPLQRGTDGRLGVAAQGSGGATVNVTIMAQDVESFARSEAQVSSALARAVARGRRAM